MPDNSTVKFSADIANLKAGMQAAQRQIRLASSEFKKASAGLDDWAKSEEGLNAKLKQLNTTLDAQRKQAALAYKEWEKTVKVYGENSAEADRAKIKLNQYESQVAKTEREINSYTADLKDCQNGTGKFADETDQATKSVSKASDGFTTAKAALADLVASGIKAAISGFKELTRSALEAYKAFDEGSDNVIKATGATGEAAKELQNSYKNVTKNVKGDFSSLGSTLGEVSTRFGFTGKRLEEATEQFTKFADITGTDATEAVRLVSRAMENAGLDTKNYSSLLDMLAKAGQDTGVNVSTLADNVTKMGAQMRQLGFSTEESIAMFAQFEKTGVNSATVLTGLKKAVATFGKDGVNASEGFRKLVDEIKEAPDVAKATEIAIESFGTKAGPELVEDIRSGKLEYQDFLKVLKSSKGTVTNTYEATQDGFDKVQLAIQGGKAELGDFVKSLASEYQEDIVAFVNKVKDAIKKTITWIINNGDLIIETIKSIGKVLAVVFAVKKISQFSNAINGAITAFKGLSTASAALGTAMNGASAAGGLFASIVSPGGAIVLGITAVIAVTASLISIFGEEKESISALTDEEQRSIQKSAEWLGSYRDMETARQNSMKGIDAEYQRYQDLAAELDRLVDENGKVKSGYESRVNYIVTELNGAIGTEMKLIDGVIQNYQTEREELQKTIEIKKAEAILSANEDAYAEAYAKKADAAKDYAEAQNRYNDVLTRAQEQGKKVAEIYAEMARIQQEEGDDALQDYINLHAEEIQEYRELEHAVTDARGGLLDMKEAYEGYNNTIKNYEGLASAILEGDQKKIQESILATESGMKDHTTATEEELKKQAEVYKQGYEEIKVAFESGKSGIEEAEVENAKRLAELAEKKYKEGGENALEGYDKGLTNPWQLAKIKTSSEGIANESVDALKKSLEENSPSRVTYQSGIYFAEGFMNGMDSKESEIYKKAYKLAQKAIEGLKKGQKEGSPSKITYQSGIYFVEGYINGIVSMTSKLTKTVQNTIGNVLKVGLSVSSNQYTKAAENAVNSFTSALSGKMEYTTKKIQYQNERKLKEFDNQIDKLNKKMNATKDEKLKNQYKKQIEEQQKLKQSYQTASNQMISEYTSAMNSYNTQAQNLITSTINGIASKYQQQYDELISKQNNLINKLKSAGDLFEISSSGVMVINDLKEQTKSIRDYSNKLAKVRKLVSDDLFNEIVSMDTKEASAYMDQLLGMSKKDLNAYVKAYEEKMKVSEKVGKSVYKKQIEQTGKDYSKELKNAFKNLPAQLKKLGNDAMKSFLEGLTKNTDYMTKQVKDYVNAFVKTFRKEFKNVTGTDLTGITKKVSEVSKTTKQSKISGNSKMVTNNYNLTQNNTSPKSLSALETYRARQQQISLVKALT